jgi:hypothetical protein
MIGRKTTDVFGTIVPATLGWNAGQPVKHALIGGVLTPPCMKNGVRQKERVTFDVLINDNSEAGYSITRCVAWSSAEAESGKGFAAKLARMLVPGRYICLFGATISSNKVAVLNNDATPVLHNGTQYFRTFDSVVVQPGGNIIINRDSLETQAAMARHYNKAKTFAGNSWDFFHRPLSVYCDQNGEVHFMSDATKAELEATNKCRNSIPLFTGMQTYGFCTVRLPEGALPVYPRSNEYDAWLARYKAAGILDANGLPMLTPGQQNVATPAAGLQMPTMGGTTTMPQMPGMPGTTTTPASTANATASALGIDANMLKLLQAALAGQGHSTEASAGGEMPTVMI